MLWVPVWKVQKMAVCLAPFLGVKIYLTLPCGAYSWSLYSRGCAACKVIQLRLTVSKLLLGVPLRFVNLSAKFACSKTRSMQFCVKFLWKPIPSVRKTFNMFEAFCSFIFKIALLKSDVLRKRSRFVIYNFLGWGVFFRPGHKFWFGCWTTVGHTIYSCAFSMFVQFIMYVMWLFQLLSATCVSSAAYYCTCVANNRPRVCLRA